MSTGAKLPASIGFQLALEVMGLLGDVVERIEIAGSLRRGKESVGDIELVASPKYMRQRDLFSGLFTDESIDPITGEIKSGAAVETGVNQLEQRCSELLDAKVFAKRLNKNAHPIAWGKPGEDSRYKAILYRSIPLDLFIVLPDRLWGPTYLIRTGPGEANGVLVTLEGVTNRDGNRGILPTGMKFDEGAIWSGAFKLDTPDERSVFAALGMPYIPPHLRTVTLYHEMAKRRRFKVDLKGWRSSIAGYDQIDQDWAVQWRETQEAIPA